MNPDRVVDAMLANLPTSDLSRPYVAKVTIQAHIIDSETLVSLGAQQHEINIRYADENDLRRQLTQITREANSGR